MARFVVHKVTGGGKTYKGTEFWDCIGTIDGEFDNFKVWDQPQVGVEFEAELKDNGKHGKSASTKGSGSGGGGRRFERDPEIGNQIMRQNALGNSRELMQSIAEMTFKAHGENIDALGKAKEAIKPVNIIKVSEIMFQYTSGKLTTAGATAATASVVSQTPLPQETKDAVTAAFPEVASQTDDPTPPKGKDIDPNDIPF